MRKSLTASWLYAVLGISSAQTNGDNQFYTFAEVIDTAPVYGKSSLECITCPDVLLGYKIGIRLTQKMHNGDIPLDFDIVSKTPITKGTWIKVGVKMNLVVPIKTAR
ncbi:hypothetical protein [Herbaspirillum huttiense]|uniref:hypothetical protein n=1 Tax=Herbaspirillum huttiense TaxID=863372 RepID=UPI0012FEA54A|nr:hypothetical protein [Herbaspirillum huttiense]